MDRLNTISPDFVVELGDFIDAAETASGEIGYLKTIEAEYARLKSPRHYVLGDHCVWTLNKEQFRTYCGAGEPCYSFDQGEFHFVILDACFRADGVPYGARNFVWTDTEIPAEEQDWLKEDLKAARGRAIVFIHQRLDVQNDCGVKSAPAVGTLGLPMICRSKMSWVCFREDSSHGFFVPPPRWSRCVPRLVRI